MNVSLVLMLVGILLLEACLFWLVYGWHFGGKAK